MLDDGRPRGVELARRRGRAAPGNALRLLDERDAQALGDRYVRGGRKVRRQHAAAGAVAQDQRSARSVYELQMGMRPAVRSVDLEDHPQKVCPHPRAPAGWRTWPAMGVTRERVPDIS